MIPKEDFMYALGKDYIALRKNLKAYCYVNDLGFSEDVFHNTMMNCYNTVNKNNITFENEQEVKYYFCKAFKINLIREKSYSNNKPKEDIIFYGDISRQDEQIIKCDFSIITSKIIDTYGIELYNVFIENLEGTAIADLQEKYGIKNLKTKLKNIKIFIKAEFE